MEIFGKNEMKTKQKMLRVWCLDRFLWEQKVAKKVKVLWQLLVGNFRQQHFLCTLVMGR